MNRRIGSYEILIFIKLRLIFVVYDFERNMYFWVDEVLNVFVFGKLNFVFFYLGMFFEVKSFSFLKLFKYNVRSICFI